MAAVGDFAPFTTVLEAALDQVLAKQGLDPSTDKRKALVKQLETLDARSGAREAFSLLIEADIPVIALLNGSRSSTKALLAGVELDDLVEEIVSVEIVSRGVV
jgi:2-haloacid dehalogenase